MRPFTSTRAPKGASLVGYALLAGLIIFISIGAVLGLGIEVRQLFTGAATNIAIRDTPTPPAPTPTPPTQPVPEEEPVEEHDIEPVSRSGTAWWEQAQGGRSNQGTITHIGGGVFLTHNHAFLPTKTDDIRSMVVMPAQDGQRTIRVEGVYNFAPNADIRAWRSTDNWQGVPAIPLMIAHNPNDIANAQARVVGWPMVKGTQGILWKSQGQLHNPTWNTVRYNGPVSGGMSGSAVMLEHTWPGVGAGRWALGTLATAGGRLSSAPEGFPIDTSPLYGYGNFTLVNPTRYASLVSTFNAIEGFNPAAMEPVLLLGSQQAGAGLSDITGTDWPEILVAGVDGGAINPGGGSNRVFITNGGPNRLVLPNRAGGTIVEGYRSGIDSIDTSLITTMTQTQRDDGVLLSWTAENEPATILLANTQTP